jgi:hypothetical protein
VGYVGFRSSANPIFVYFLTPLFAALASLLVMPRRRRRFLSLLAICASCSLTLFFIFPDPKTPLLGKFEYWLVIGIAGFSLLPALLVEGVAQLIVRPRH